MAARPMGKKLVYEETISRLSTIEPNPRKNRNKLNMALSISKIKSKCTLIIICCLAYLPLSYADLSISHLGCKNMGIDQRAEILKACVYVCVCEQSLGLLQPRQYAQQTLLRYQVLNMMALHTVLELLCKSSQRH